VSDAIDRMIERHGPDAICSALEPMLTPERIAHDGIRPPDVHVHVSRACTRSCQPTGRPT
jgi:hypothetical protein